MGVYASNDELKARFENNEAVAHLTGTQESGTPDEAVLTEVLGNAEGDVESYAAVKYAIPLKVGDHTSLANQIKSKVLDLAVWYLSVRAASVTEAIQLAYDNAIAWLEKLATGKVMLATNDTEPTSVSKEPLISIGTSDASDPSSERIFTRPSQSAS